MKHSLVGLVVLVGLVGLKPQQVAAVDCSRTPGGNVTISSSCTFPGTVDGADVGSGTSNTADIAVSGGATLTIGAGQTISTGTLTPSGGSIAIISGGQIKIGSPLWMYDADGDGYPKESTMAAQAVADPGWRRRNLMTSLTQRDCQDFSNSGYGCVPATNDLTNGTYSGAYQEDAGNPAQSYRELPADRNTVGLWRMNEASGNIVDSSGNSNTGTATGTTVVTGKFGNGRQFNGSDRAVVANSSSLNLGLPLSIEFWLKSTTTTQDVIIVRQTDFPSWTWNYMITTNDSGGKLRLALGGVGYNTNTDVFDGVWHHVAVTINSAGAVQWYTDGQARESYTGGTTLKGTSVVCLGSYQTDANNCSSTFFLHGSLDEVRISNVARTPEEIKADAQRKPSAVYTAPVNDLGQTPGSWSGMTVKAKGVRTGDGETPHSTNSLIAQWNFNETSGTTAAASAGSCGASCNGTLTNFASTASQDQAAGTGWTGNNKRWGAGALMFDGSNDYVQVSSTNKVANSANSTVEAWVNWSGKISTTNTIYAEDQSDGVIYTLAIDTVGRPAFNIWVSGTWYPAMDSRTLEPGKWNHIVGTFSTTAGTKLYVNGINVKSSPSYTAQNVSTVTSVQLGRTTNGGGANYFQGILDSVRTYSRTLTAAEILANYQAGNIEFQTRTGSTSSPLDGTWEAWKPVTGETAIDSMDGPYQYNTTDTGLVSYWPMDETADNSCSGGVNDICDKKTTNDGVATGTKIIDGKFGKARSFNGTSDRIQFADTSSLRLPLPYTIDFWLKSSTTTADSTIISRTPHPDTWSWNYLIAANQGGAKLRFTTGASGYNMYTDVLNGVWHHIAISITSQGVLQWYVDGVAKESYTGVTTDSGASVICMGSYHTASPNTCDSAYFFNGSLDEFRIYNTALSATTILQHFQEGIDQFGAGSGRTGASTDTTTKIEGTGALRLAVGGPQVDASTVGLWHMEETSGTGAYIKDARGGEFSVDTNGTLENNLTGYWKIDETSGTRNDSFGSNHLTDNATVTNNSGKIGNAGQFTAANSEYLSITDNAALSTGDIDFTVAGWVYLDSKTVDRTIVAKASGGSAATTEYQLMYRCCSIDRFMWRVSNGSGFTSVNADNLGVPATGAWYYVVAWHDSVNNVIGIQVNNGTANTTSYSGGLLDTAFTHAIGAAGNSGGDFWDGRIDEVGFWKKVLTTQEKTDLYNSTTGQTYSGGGGLHGTPTGTTVIDGFYGKGRNFNGSSDYVSAADTSLPSGQSNRTVSAWIKTTTTSESAIVAYGTGSGGLFQLEVYQNKLSINFNGSYIQSTGTVNDGKWRHVAVTQNGTSYLLYIDGIQDGSGTNAASTVLNGTVYLGVNYVPGSYFAGSIDEVKIDNVVRTAEEIAEAYRAGRDHRLSKTISPTDLSSKTKLPFWIASDRAGTFAELAVCETAFTCYEPDANTIGLWHLEEQSGSGAYIRDTSSSGNNGTPTGTMFAQGKLGKARSFNGTSDYIKMTSSPTSSTTNWTMAAWVNPASLSQNAVIMGNGSAQNGYKMHIGQDGAASGKLWGLLDLVAWMDSGYTFSIADKWYYVVMTRDASTVRFYVDGVQTPNTYTNTPTAPGNYFTIGAKLNFGPSDPGWLFSGKIDEVSFSNTVRTADEIRQAFEYGRRTHPITIDFVTSPQAAYSSGTSVTINNPYGTTALTNSLSVGDTIIFKENVNGTETVGQATVNTIANTTSTYGTVTLASAPTFPSGGFTTNATVFKWQREYFDIKGMLASHVDAVTRLTWRVTDGSAGANVWLDDVRSGSYINRTTCDTLNTTTGECTYTIPSSSVTSSLNRYFQLRAIMSTWDTAVSPIFTSSQIEYGL